MTKIKFKTIGIIVKEKSGSVKDILDKLFVHLKELSCTILLDETAKDIPGDTYQILSRNELGQSTDLIIVIGGDGTFLHAARSLADKNVPLLGINIGRLGFLVDISPDELDTCMMDILNGAYIKEERFLLDAYVDRNGEKIFSADALNDVVVHIRDVARMIEFETRINNQFVNLQRADGLIVSTPTGSTAYSLSTGGPLLHSTLDVISLVPISPHTLSNRPIIVNSDSTIEVLIRETNKTIAKVTCDGQTSFDVSNGDRIIIQRKQNTITLLHPKSYDYYNLLRAKLHWSEHP